MKYLLISASLLFSASSFAGEDIDRSLDFVEGGAVSINVESGDVQIEVWDKAQIQVVGELDSATEKFVFEVSGKKAIIDVETKDGYWRDSSGSDLVVRIPASTEVMAKGVSTDYELEGITAGASFKLVSGDVTVKSVKGDLSVNTVSGDVVVKDSEGKMNLQTVSGDIDAGSKARQFDVATVSGDLEAILGLVDSIDMSSVSGDFEVSFTLADDGRIEAETVSGDIELEFGNSQVNARFDLETGPGGDINNDLSDDKSEPSFIGSNDISFKLGNGSANIEIDTMSGKISLKN